MKNLKSMKINWNNNQTNIGWFKSDRIRENQKWINSGHSNFFTDLISLIHSFIHQTINLFTLSINQPTSYKLNCKNYFEITYLSKKGWYIDD